MTEAVAGHDKIHDTDRLEVFWRRGQGDTLLVTFNELGACANGRTYWGQAIAERLDLPCLGLMARTPDWFPASAVLPLVDALQVRTQGFRRVVLYGHSMGAYAALRYSALLQATHVLAFCPQVSINPATLGAHDDRFTPWYKASLHADMDLRHHPVAGRVRIFYDPWHRQDAWHVQAIAGHHPVEGVAVFGAGHQCVRFVSRSTLFQGLLDRLDAPAPQMFAYLRACKKTWPLHAALLWARRSARLAERGHLAPALTAAQRAHAADPADPDMLRQLSVLYTRLKRFDDAIASARQGIALQPGSPHAYNHLAWVLGEAGQLADALTAIDTAVALAPTVSGYHRHRAGLLWRRGRADEALASAQRAVELGPRIAHNHDQLACFLAARGRHAEAAVAAAAAVDLAPTHAPFRQRLHALQGQV